MERKKGSPEKMIARLAEKLRLFCNSLNLEEKLLAFYILSFVNTGAYLFIIRGKKILFADIIFIFLGAVSAWKIIKSKEGIPGLQLKMPLAVMVLLFMPSFISSVDLKTSFMELAGLAYLICLFIVIPRIITTERKLKIFLYLWLFTALCVSLVGLSAFFAAMVNKDLVRSPFLYYTAIESVAHHFPRIHSTFQISNMFFSYLHASIVLAVILALLEPNRKRKRFLRICISLLFITSLLTGSRRFAGLLLTLFLILSLYAKTRPTLALKNITFSGFLFFLTLYIATSIWVVFPVGFSRDNVSRTLNFTVEGSYSPHIISPLVSINMIKNHPILGTGFGAYNRHFADYADWEWLKENVGLRHYPGYIKSIEEKTLNFDPHSLYLGALAETGLLGFIGLLFFLVKYLSLLLRRLKGSVFLDLPKIISGCILSGYIGFLLNAMTIDILSMRHFWVMLAIGLSCI